MAKNYNNITTIQIDEEYVPVSVDFQIDSDGDVDILKMTDLSSGDAIAPDLLGEIDIHDLYKECREMAADLEADAGKKYWPVNYNAL